MKILTWNINGIRASKVPLKELFDGLEADIICLQETKVTRDMLDERTAVVEGYTSYFSFSNVKTGYSGVATYVRDHSTPIEAEEGLSGVRSHNEESSIGCYGDYSDFTEEEVEALDNEGRAILTKHKMQTNDGNEVFLVVINVYCPRADPERDDRKAFKIRFYELLQIRAQTLLKSGCHVIILGDINTSHKRIDHCDPGNDSEFFKNLGRQWLDQILWAPPMCSVKGHDKSTGVCECKTSHISRSDNNKPSNDGTEHKFVDTFRLFHPNKTHAFTCWNTMKSARETNYGTRLDYIFANKTLAVDGFTGCEILPEVMGSDHCPVRGTLSWACQAANKLPDLCTKNFPEFAGRQTKLSTFFTKGVKRPLTESPQCPEPSLSQDGPQQPCLKKATTYPPPPAKKLKHDKQDSGKKQTNLAIFFGKTTNPDKILGTVHGKTKSVLKKNMAKLVIPSIDKYTGIAAEKNTLQNKPKEASAMWKNLLKGPPPAPPCKGHGEPCLLRTVKKEESLNKGRQFYVCCRPDGHKSNPEARCDHFEWVKKKNPSNTTTK